MKEILKNLVYFIVFIYIIILNCQLVDSRQDCIRKEKEVQQMNNRIHQYQEILKQKPTVGAIPYKQKNDNLKEKGSKIPNVESLTPKGKLSYE